MQPLEGFRVLDLTHVLAGPCATHHLRCLGAEVIKIERPGTGDPMRALSLQPEQQGVPPGFRALNAGKKSVVIDLATDEGRAAVLRLAESADVFVENFRPGVARRLGLGAEDFSALPRGIVYCSTSGCGQSGQPLGAGVIDLAVADACGRCDVAAAHAGRAQDADGSGIVVLRQGGAQGLGAPHHAGQGIADADGCRRGRRLALLYHVEMGVEGRHFVDLGLRQPHLVCERHQVAGVQAAVSVLEKVQEFDQQVPAARTLAEKSADLVMGGRVELAAFGPVAAAALASPLAATVSNWRHCPVSGWARLIVHDFPLACLPFVFTRRGNLCPHQSVFQCLFARPYETPHAKSV